MKLLKRLAFAYHYDFEPEFVVIPFGKKNYPCRFLRHEDALEFTKKCKDDDPMFEQPSVMIHVRRHNA